MGIIYLAIFFVFLGVHLYGCLENNTMVRCTTKGTLLLALLGLYLEATEDFRWVVAAAILLSWAGDVLLIPDGTAWFVAGGLCFMASHFMFILSYLEDINFSSISMTEIIVHAVVYAAVVCYLFSRYKQFIKKSLFYPMFLYLLINGAMNCFAVFRCISSPSFINAVTSVGALLFFVSDCVLFFVRFNKNTKIKTHFAVMFTYSLGELLIVLGLI